MTRQSAAQSPKPKSASIEFFADKIICGDALQTLARLPPESVDCVVTSPPYWLLRDYGTPGQIGLEASLEEYLDRLIAVFDEIRRILKPHGTCWVNFGDTYANKTKGGQKNKRQGNLYDALTRKAVIPKIAPATRIRPKSLCLVPARFALRLIERGWILRNEIIWHKPNVLPQSVEDRFTVDFERLFFFVKNPKYYFRQQFEPLNDKARLTRPAFKPGKRYKYDLLANSPVSKKALDKSRPRMLERGRNRRCVWRIGTGSYRGEHFAVFPEKLIETPIKAGCPENGIVLDPFLGSGTTALVARKLGRRYLGIELNSSYVRLARARLRKEAA